tara:strand:- start:327 stop:572 length:246 start_codon:yes stop_codon:yes gene_type:complete
MDKFNDNELTHLRLTITVDKRFSNMVDDLLEYINENLLADTSEQINEVFHVEKGGIYKDEYYRELNKNDYNISLGDRKRLN